jgi:hypothetical protein
MVNARLILIAADVLFVATVTVMHFTGGLHKNPLFLNFLVVAAFGTCVIRHVNYYKLTKRLY